MLKKLRKMLKQQEGFTLVELMIVVVILGIISGIGIQQYGRVQESARESAHEANLRIIHGAAQMYFLMEDESTSNIEDLEDGYLDKVPDSPWDNGSPYTLEITKDGEITVSGGKAE